MNMLSAWDAFNNPDSPLYYIVGSCVLLLVFVALAIYLIVTKRKNKGKTVDPEETATEPEPNAKEETPPVETESVAEEKQEAVKAEETVETKEQPEEPVVKAEEQPQEKAEEKTEEPPIPTEKPQQKPAAKRTVNQKTFIDRLIAAKSVHGTYNALKNTILSYTGVKAKLTKDCEQFSFGTDLKASIELVGNEIKLNLALDPATAPAQLNVSENDGELKSTVTVTEAQIDNAQKAIIFAMNVSMLTRSERKRFTDYVQNAINAKNRAKK